VEVTIDERLIDSSKQEDLVESPAFSESNDDSDFIANVDEASPKEPETDADDTEPPLVVAEAEADFETSENNIEDREETADESLAAPTEEEEELSESPVLASDLLIVEAAEAPPQKLETDAADDSDAHVVVSNVGADFETSGETNDSTGGEEFVESSARSACNFDSDVLADEGKVSPQDPESDAEGSEERVAVTEDLLIRASKGIWLSRQLFPKAMMTLIL
jgi:hypothetical protein